MPGKRASVEVRREQILEAALAVGYREGIGGLTVRAIAAHAQVSHGLVLFHFKTKGQLVRAVLEWVLESTLTVDVGDSNALSARPLDRLWALLNREMERLSREPGRMRLFFEYWAMGTRDRVVGERISAELERYRSSLRAVTEEVLASEPAAFAGVTSDGLAAVVVSFINGCAVQAMIDPGRFDIEEYLAAVNGMIGQLRPQAESGPAG